MKVALMGQNGAGKSTLFKLITKELYPISGEIPVDKRLVVSTARQVIALDDMPLTVEEYFQKQLGEDVESYEIRKRLSSALNAVSLNAPLDKIIKSFSGGQQARLLLASALVKNPDLLLLDEPTNHINFRHLPRIAEALNDYRGMTILVSHVSEFVAQIRIDETLDLEK